LALAGAPGVELHEDQTRRAMPPGHAVVSFLRALRLSTLGQSTLAEDHDDPA